MLVAVAVNAAILEAVGAVAIVAATAATAPCMKISLPPAMTVTKALGLNAPALRPKWSATWVVSG